MSFVESSAARASQVECFVAAVCGSKVSSVQALAGDASSRRYWRASFSDGRSSVVVMDDLSVHNGVAHFAELSRVFRRNGSPVPIVYGYDAKSGLLVLEDFGDQWLSVALAQDAPRWLHAALTLLADWQCRQQPLVNTLPRYDAAALAREFDLFAQWFVPRVALPIDVTMLADVRAELLSNIVQHPCVCVCRDYHSRNIMLREDGSLGLLDYQDAVVGSAAYDVISLTRDCYIRYPKALVRQVEAQFARDHVTGVDAVQWRRYCDEVALQRHLKVLGIFVRLDERDAKSVYLDDIPRVLMYAAEEAQTLGFGALSAWLTQAQTRWLNHCL